MSRRLTNERCTSRVSYSTRLIIDSIIAAIAALVGVALGGFIESLRSRRLFQSAQRFAYFEREVNLVQELFEAVVAHRHAYELAITASMGILRWCIA